MYDGTGFAWVQGQKIVPTGVYSGPPSIGRLAERQNTIVHWPEHNPAGHHTSSPWTSPTPMQPTSAPSSPS
jgi:hypothetical protein